MIIAVLGYYGHGNYGDDLFEVIFKKLYSEHTLYFYDPNKITYLQEWVDVIICGGGDIINDWFMNKIAYLKIRAEQKYKKRIPTYAISIGITFKNSIPNDKPYYLDIFDYWIVRNKIDVDILKKRYPENNIIYVPDVVHLLNTYKSKKLLTSFRLLSRPIIGIFLTNTISSDGTNQKYDQEVTKFSELISSIPNNFDIHLVPFNMGINRHENDSILNTAIYKKLDEEQKKRVTLNNFTLNELVSQFRSNIYNYGICMRYHSHILCQTYSVPFISISMTNKTYEYMKDFGIDRYLIDYTDRNIDISQFNILFNKLIEDKRFFSTQTESRYIKVNKFLDPVKNKIIRNSGPQYFLIEDYIKIFNRIIENLIKTIFANLDLISVTNTFVATYSLKDVYTKFKIDFPDKQKRKFITDFIIYELLGIIESEYNYGLESKIIECNLYENILWIYQNRCFKGLNSIEIKESDKSVFNLQLNFKYIDNSCIEGVHRSGWAYVTKPLMNKFHSSKSNIIIDLYVDKTFLWCSSIYETNKKIPYTSAWIGFIHHTPNPEYTPHSLNAILESENFKLSLRYCKGLIVLSNYLKNYLDGIFKGKVLIYTLTHPTETPELKFSISKFETNLTKQIIQIGGWLRNSYAIYDLNINKKKLNISKALLQGKFMENYVKPNDFNILSSITNSNSDIEKRMCSSSSNKYIEGLKESIERKNRSVQIIQELSNDEYDELLSENIVFLNLINVSACNTLIECVVRNTPILINRLEGVEEILGTDYPFYYDDIEEASDMATDINLIKKTYEYLVKLDKSKLNLETFINEFEKILQNFI